MIDYANIGIRKAENDYDWNYCVGSSRKGDFGRMMLIIEAVSVMRISEYKNLEIVIGTEKDGWNHLCIRKNRTDLHIYKNDIEKSNNRVNDFLEGWDKAIKWYKKELDKISIIKN